MRIAVNVLLLLCFLILVGFSSFYILTNDYARRPKLAFGAQNINITVVKQKPVKIKDKNIVVKSADVDPDSLITDIRKRKNLEIAWGQWHANIYNALVVDYLKDNQVICPENTSIDISFDVSKSGEIVDPRVDTTCLEIKDVILRGINGLKGSQSLRFPLGSLRESRQFGIRVFTCYDATNSACGNKANAKDFPDYEKYSQ